jgi:steroid delta-isomerase-like uncharacterized protein
MTHPTAEELASRLFEAMNSRDFNTLEAFVTEDVSFDFPGAGTIEGKRRVILFMKALLRKYPRLEFTVSDVVTSEGRAVAVWTNIGERSDGAAYHNSGVTLFHFENGMIRFISDYFKDTSFVSAP